MFKNKKSHDLKKVYIYLITCVAIFNINLNADESIPTKQVGTFKSDKHYLNAVKILISSTDETNNRINFIREEIIPHTENDSVLDVGVGNGEQTSILCDKFKNIELVDPSQDALSSIHEELFPENTIKKHLCKIENFAFPKNKHDLVLISHALYYIPRAQWNDVVSKAFGSLKVGGKLLIVLNNGLGRSELTSHFGYKNALQIESFIGDCASIRNASVTVIPKHETFKPRNQQEALEIAGVCLLDVGGVAHKEAVIRYLNNRFMIGDSGQYNIDFIQYFIIIEKKQ